MGLFHLPPPPKQSPTYYNWNNLNEFKVAPLSITAPSAGCNSPVGWNVRNILDFLHHLCLLNSWESQKTQRKAE